MSKKSFKVKFISVITAITIVVSGYCVKRNQFDNRIGILYNLILKDYNGEEYIDYDSLYKSDTVENDEIVEDVYYSIPELDDLVPQGITIADEYILVSAYNPDLVSNSFVFALDKDGNLINKAELDTPAHVGSLSYDINNNLVWIASLKGTVNAYLLNDLLKRKKVYSYYKDLNIGYDLINYIGEPAVSYLTIKDDLLYVGNFTSDEKGTLKAYSIRINADKSVSLFFEGVYTVPNKIQGVAFYKYNDKEYIMFSRSFGKCNPSILQIYPFNENVRDFSSPLINSVCYETPQMMEQICICDDDIYSLYEKNALVYGGSRNNHPKDISVLDADNAVKRLEK